MKGKIIIKNRKNYFFTIVGLFTLVVLTLIILMIIFSAFLQYHNFIDFILGFLNIIPFLMFFIIFLYLWIWVTFGRTEIKTDAKSLEIIQHNKLFSRPVKMNLNQIVKMNLEDLTIEKTKYNVRFHSFSNYNCAVKIYSTTENFYAIKWISKENAEEVISLIQKKIKMSYN